MFLAANASYRATFESRAERAVVLRGLDEALKRYGDVLGAEPDHTGAAYNYEFVSRLRTALGKGRQGNASPPRARRTCTARKAIRRRARNRPDFNVIVPLRPDERQEQFDAGVGGVPTARMKPNPVRRSVASGAEFGVGSWQLGVNTLQFAEPRLLWLLVLPAVAAGAADRGRSAVRRRDARRFAAARQVPVRERFPVWGGVLFWGCLITSTALLFVSLAQPRVVASTVRRAGVDLVVLLDGSASMHVRDVEGNRWQRSIRFLRTLGDSLSWDDDRMALTLFAHIAAPQVRLTRDPNTFFFFLDHLRDGPPFRLEDDTSWDTNIALGIEWGLRLIEKDEELRGKSPNAKQFVLLTDGQAFSGVVEDALKLTRAARRPDLRRRRRLAAGWRHPGSEACGQPGAAHHQVRAGSYLAELRLRRGAEAGTSSSTAMATSRLQTRLSTRRAAGPSPRRRNRPCSPVYWQFLFAAACLAVAAVLFLRDRSELWIQAVGAGVVLIIVRAFLR